MLELDVDQVLQNHSVLDRIRRSASYRTSQLILQHKSRDHTEQTNFSRYFRTAEKSRLASFSTNVKYHMASYGAWYYLFVQTRIQGHDLEDTGNVRKVRSWVFSFQSLSIIKLSTH